MKRSLLFLIGLLGLGQVAFGDVRMVVDTAPADTAKYDAWRTEAFDSITQPSGWDTNMAHGVHAGQAVYVPDEVIVDNKPDWGKRLQWVFWISDETIASLTDRFSVRTQYDWDTYEYSGLDGNGWVSPAGWVDWEERNGGVVGTFGDAFLVYQDAQGNGYADKDSLRAAILQFNTHFLGEIAVLDSAGETWNMQAVDAKLVPTPLAAPAGVVLLGALVAARWSARRKTAA